MTKRLKLIQNLTKPVKTGLPVSSLRPGPAPVPSAASAEGVESVAAALMAGADAATDDRTQTAGLQKEIT